MAFDLNVPSVAIRIHRNDVVDGARAITPIVLGVVPFGIAIGAVAAKSHGHAADMPAIATSVAAFVVVRRTRNMTCGLLAGCPSCGWSTR